MTSSSCILGPFRLGPELARGGMAVVHRGQHLASGTGVAIKVVTGAATPKNRQALAHEVRQVARLHHPAVIRVHDQGVLPEEAAALGLDPGSPWLAMDLLEGGTLEQAPPQSWTELRKGVKSLLGALAHAHAHGIIHRDLKPANVLLTRQGRTVLTDFGIAFAGQPSSSGRLVGTPQVMAPEQVQGRWRDVGPWTDLYALGCTVWWLSTGRPPWTGPTLPDLFSAHLSEELPPFSALYPVPDGLAGWLAQLLARAPHDRPQCAADARHALDALDDPEDTRPLASVVVQRFSTAQTFHFDEALPTGDIGGPGPRAPTAPVRRPTRPTVGLRGFSDAGLGLFGLRHPPLVGRDAAWSLLCDTLLAVAEDGVTRTVGVVGKGGVGTSWLVNCFARAAHEAGAALPLPVSYPRNGDIDGQLASAILRHFRCLDLPHVEATSRLTQALNGLDPDFRPHMADALVSPEQAGDRRLAAAWSAIRALAARRPVLLVIDDAHWSEEAVEIVRRGTGWPAPVMMLATGDAAFGTQLAESTSEAQILRIPPLDRSTLTELLDTVLGLHTSVLNEIAIRAGGRPREALALARDLVHRGGLVSGPTGLELVRGEIPLPEDHRSLWLGRLDTVAESEASTAAVELAAVMGRWIDVKDWHRLSGVEDGALLGLLGQLTQAGLVDGSQDRFRLSSTTLEDAIRWRARERGTWWGHFQNILDSLPTEPNPAALYRRGELLHAAGRHAEALEPLSAAFELLVDKRRPRHANLAVVTWLEAVHAAGIDPADPTQVKQWDLVFHIYLQLGWLDAAIALADELEPLPGVSDGSAPLSVSYAYVRSEADRIRGDLVASESWAERMVAWNLRHQTIMPGKCEYILGRVLSEQLSKRDAARAMIWRAYEVLTPTWKAACLGHMGMMAYSDGDHDEALRLYKAAAPFYPDIEGDAERAMLDASMAQLAGDRGELEVALAGWTRALRYMEEAGHMSEAMVRLNVALVHVKLGQLEEARAHAWRARRDFTRMGRRPNEASACALLSTIAAADARWADVTEQLAGVSAASRGAVFSEPDHAWSLERAGVICSDAGQHALARTCLEMAQAHYVDALGRDDHGERVQAHIDALAPEGSP